MLARYSKQLKATHMCCPSTAAYCATQTASWCPQQHVVPKLMGCTENNQDTHVRKLECRMQDGGAGWSLSGLRMESQWVQDGVSVGAGWSLSGCRMESQWVLDGV